MKQNFYKIIITVMLIISIMIFVYNLYYSNKIKKQITNIYKSKIDSLYIQIHNMDNTISNIKEQAPIIIQKKTQITYKINKQYTEIDNMDTKIDSIKFQLAKLNNKE